MCQAKRVYAFGEDDASMKYVLGGKGANLAEMTGLGQPMPPGFTRHCAGCAAGGSEEPENVDIVPNLGHDEAPDDARMARMSPEAARRLCAYCRQFVRELEHEACRVRRRRHGDSIEHEDVQRALVHISSAEHQGMQRVVGVVGGLLAGVGVQSLFDIAVGGRAEVPAVLASAAALVSGAVMTTVSVLRE